MLFLRDLGKNGHCRPNDAARAKGAPPDGVDQAVISPISLMRTAALAIAILLVWSSTPNAQTPRPKSLVHNHSPVREFVKHRFVVTHL